MAPRTLPPMSVVADSLDECAAVEVAAVEVTVARAEVGSSRWKKKKPWSSR